DKKIAGVCAGIGDYFNMDHTLVRALWIIFTLLGGSGILAYAILYFLLPEGNAEA
ncbi:PspC domain-containing protein, partial [Streptococcus oralis]